MTMKKSTKKKKSKMAKKKSKGTGRCSDAIKGLIDPDSMVTNITYEKKQLLKDCIDRLM